MLLHPGFGSLNRTRNCSDETYCSFALLLTRERAQDGSVLLQSTLWNNTEYAGDANGTQTNMGGGWEQGGCADGSGRSASQSYNRLGEAHPFRTLLEEVSQTVTLVLSLSHPHTTLILNPFSHHTS